MNLIDFKNYPDTTTPINAENLNNNFKEVIKICQGDVLFDGETDSNGYIKNATSRTIEGLSNYEYLAILFQRGTDYGGVIQTTQYACKHTSAMIFYTSTTSWYRHTANFYWNGDIFEFKNIYVEGSNGNNYLTTDSYDNEVVKLIIGINRKTFDS